MRQCILCSHHLLTYNCVRVFIFWGGDAPTSLRNKPPTTHPTKKLSPPIYFSPIDCTPILPGQAGTLFCGPPYSTCDGYLEACCCSCHPASIIIWRICCFHPNYSHIYTSAYPCCNSYIPSCL